jgi:hypothetical protein
MGEIIASLDGYFYWPEHNFDLNAPNLSINFQARQNPSIAAQDLQHRRLPLQSNHWGG